MLYEQRGSAALPAILALSGIIVALGVVISTFSFFETQSAVLSVNSLEAFAVGEAGLEDAAIRLARIKSFAHPGYTLTLGEGSVIIKSEQGAPGAGQVTITSETTVENNIRTLKFVFDVSSYGKLTGWSWMEE